MAREGWTNILEMITPLKMKICRAMNHDLEGFIGALRIRINRGKFWHNFNYPEDIIKNEFDLNKVEDRKIKWLAFEKLTKEK